MADATFEEGAERPLRLKAESAEDVAVLSALLQDAVGAIGDAVWMPRRRRFAVFLNRFRWEDRERAERTGRPYERVRSVVMIDNALAVRALGVSPADKDMALSILSVTFEPGEDCEGVIRVTLAGDGEIAIDVECLEVTLEDVTRPYVAPSRRVPVHAID